MNNLEAIIEELKTHLLDCQKRKERLTEENLELYSKIEKLEKDLRDEHITYRKLRGAYNACKDFLEIAIVQIGERQEYIERLKEENQSLKTSEQSYKKILETEREKGKGVKNEY